MIIIEFPPNYYVRDFTNLSKEVVTFQSLLIVNRTLASVLQRDVNPRSNIVFTVIIIIPNLDYNYKDLEM